MNESVARIHIFFMECFTAMFYPGGSREHYRYDAVGNPVSEVRGVRHYNLKSKRFKNSFHH